MHEVPTGKVPFSFIIKSNLWAIQKVYCVPELNFLNTKTSSQFCYQREILPWGVDLRMRGKISSKGRAYVCCEMFPYLKII